MGRLPFPKFYDLKRVGELYLPRVSDVVAEGATAGLGASAGDQRKMMLLLVDPQVGFVHADGSLSVPGAIEDTKRTIEWIFHNASELTTVAASLDSHLLYQIFSPLWWADAKGNHPAPFTPITAAEVQKGVWSPVVEPVWSLEYVKKLEAGGRYSLMIWPYHTMIGSPDQAIVPSLFEVILWHAAARHTQPNWLVKGSIPKTENYSILEPEVKVDGHPAGGLNTAFLDALAAYRLIYVAGQAKSHCVLWTMRSIMTYFANRPDVIAKLRFLIDCTSSVQHPAVDFDALANAELGEMEKQGMRLVKSTDPIG